MWGRVKELRKEDEEGNRHLWVGGHNVSQPHIIVPIPWAIQHKSPSLSLNFSHQASVDGGPHPASLTGSCEMNFQEITDIGMSDTASNLWVWSGKTKLVTQPGSPQTLGWGTLRSTLACVSLKQSPLLSGINYP